jgi:hypothetical protein
MNEINMNIPEGYEKKELLINPVWANIFVFLIFFPTILVFGLPYYFIWSGSIDFLKNLVNNVSFFEFIRYFLPNFGVLIAGIITHELIHGIFFAKYASNGWKSVKFGIIWKYLAPYCNCKELLKVRHYIIAVIMPTIILGLIPCFISLISGDFALLKFGILFTLCGGGDILIIWSLRNENKEDLMLDHPTKIGCYVFRKENNTL